MIETLLALYGKGAITADHLTWECIRLLDPENPGLVLSGLPPDVLVRTYQIVRSARPNDLVTNFGSLPTAEQVVAARRWIDQTSPEIVRRSA